MTYLDRREFVQRLLGAALLAGTAGFEACTHAQPASPEPTPGPAPNLATLDRVTLKHFSGATAEVSRRGAQVLSWKRANGVEMPPFPLVNARLKAMSWKMKNTAMVTTTNVCRRTRSAISPNGTAITAPAMPPRGSSQNAVLPSTL